MRALIFIFLASASLTTMTGCHCIQATDRVMDRIDDLTDINDHRYKLDCHYCEKLDVTRWCLNGSCSRHRCR